MLGMISQRKEVVLATFILCDTIFQIFYGELRMKKIFALIVLLTYSAFAQDKPLNNADIIEMSKASLPTSVIISKIKASKTDFDTSIDGLKSLNTAQVDEAVITAMIETSAVIPKIDITPKNNGHTEGAGNLETNKTKSNLYSPQPDPNFSKETEKQRFKRSAEIQIGASKEIVGQTLIAALQNWNYQLDRSDNNVLVMSKEVSGIGNQILLGMATGDTKARYQIQINLTEVNRITTVMLNVSIQSQNAFGRTKSDSLNSNKKLRREIDGLLLQVKASAEYNTEGK